MSLPVNEAIMAESRSMGRPCTVVEHHYCKDGTLFLLYDVEPYRDLPGDKSKAMNQRRVAVYRPNGTQMFSGIVATSYDDDGGRHQ